MYTGANGALDSAKGDGTAQSGTLPSWDGHRGKIVGKQTDQLAFFLTEFPNHS